MRLWPLSREAFPKQFHRLTGPETLFQQTSRRLSGALSAHLPSSPIIATASSSPSSSRRSAPRRNHRARAVRPQYGARRLLLAPADHTIADDAALGRAVESGASLAAAEEYLDSGNFYWNAPEILAGVGLHQVEQGRGLEQEQPGRCRADCR